MFSRHKISEKIRKIRVGESRTLISNFLSLSLLQIAGYIFPLLTVPYLANVIGVNRYGENAFGIAVIVYFQTLVDYGFVFSAVRDIARNRDNMNKVTEIYSKVMWARLFLVLLAFILLLSLIILVPKFMELKWVLLASFLMVIGHAMFPDWMFQALERMKYVTIFNVFVKIIFTVAVINFIKNEDDYLLQPIFTSLGYIISGIGAMILIRKWGIELNRPNLRVVFGGLKENFDLFINQLVPNLYNSASVLLLGFFHGNAANGIFDAANKFNLAGASLFSIISRTFYPFLSRRIDKHAYFRRINILCAIVVSLSLFILAPFIIHSFFPSDFDEAITTLRIVSISLIFLALNNVYGTNYLILKGKERRVRQITLYSSVIGLFTGIPAVYYLSYFGVAVTILVSRALMGIWCMIDAKNLEHSIISTNK